MIEIYSKYWMLIEKNEMGQNQRIIKFLKSYHTNKKNCKIKDQKHANKIIKQKINEKKKLSPNI